MASRDATSSRLLTAGRSQPRRRPLLVATAALLVFGLGMGAGRLFGGDGTTANPGLVPATPPAASSPPTPQPPNALARTPQGAARAAGAALTSLADPRLLSSPRARRAVIASLATPGYRPQLEPRFERTYSYLSGLLGDSGRPGDLVLRMAPVGYRVEAFSGRRAVVAVWQVTLLATPARAPIAAWSTSRAELVWTRGRWRVERFGADVPGPTPGASAPIGADAPADFVTAAEGFTPFRP